MSKKKKDKLEETKSTSRLSKREDILRNINKKYGIDTVIYAKEVATKERIPFGIKEIDDFIGGGSICGNFITIYGGESVGKTSLCYFHIGNAQKLKKVCAYIDLEHSFDANRAEEFEVNLDELILFQNLKTAEDAMDIVIKLSKEKVVDLIIIDSIQAMSPTGEQQTKRGIDKSIEEDEMALLAKKMGKFFRVAGTPVAKGKVSVVLIGQARTEGIGSFFVREGLTGGRALKHFNVLTLHMRSGSKADAPRDKKTKELIGFNCGIKVEKHKISGCKPIGTEIMLPFHFNEGFTK